MALTEICNGDHLTLSINEHLTLPIDEVQKYYSLLAQIYIIFHQDLNHLMLVVANKEALLLLSTNQKFHLYFFIDNTITKKW